MNLREYIESVKERLLTDPLVDDFEILRERITYADGYLRVRVDLSGASQLEFSEYVQSRPDGSLEVVTYSYHWKGRNGDLILRWDNTPHFPNLQGFPHHIHRGKTAKVESGKPVDIFIVLDKIAEIIKSRK